MKKGLLIFLMVMIVSLLVSCTINDINRSVTVKEVKSLHALQKLHVNNINGSVTWDLVSDKTQEGIIVEKVAYGTDQEQMEAFLRNKVDVKVAEDEENSTIEIIPITDYTTLPEGIKSVAINLTIRTTLDVKDVEIETINGDVEIHDEFNGILNLTTTNGDINVNHATGEAYLISYNTGSIEINFTGIFLEATAKNGSIDANTSNVIEEARLITANGDLNFESSKIQTGIYTLECSNGNITVGLLKDNGLDIEARVSNGAISCEHTGYDSEDDSGFNGEYFDDFGTNQALLILKTQYGNIDILENF